MQDKTEEERGITITQVKVRLVQPHKSKLRAVCSVTINDSLVIKDLKVIEAPRGLLVVMPSRKLTDKCPVCRMRNHLNAGYCSGCGSKQPTGRAKRDASGRPLLNVEVAHPLNSDTRNYIQEEIIRAYKEELKLAEGQDDMLKESLLDETSEDDSEDISSA
ncbi:MAG: SpoVG family protein [Planctomycetota bacterium]